MRDRLCAAMMVGMWLVGDIAAGHLMSTLWEEQNPVQGPMRGDGLIADAAMIAGRTPPAVVPGTMGLNPATTGGTIPDREIWPTFAQPPIAVERASWNIAAPTEVLGLTDRQGDEVAFDFPGVVADHSLAPLADMTRALGMTLVPFPSRVPDPRETFAPAFEDKPPSEDRSPTKAHPNDGIHIAAALALATPLQDFGVPPALGVGVSIPQSLEIIATPLGVSAFQRVAVPGADFVAGMTPLGPLAGIDVFQGPVRVRGGVLWSGQLMSVAALTFQAGNVTLTYAAGPVGSSLNGEIINGPVDFTFSMTGSELRVGLACVLEL